MFLRSKRVDLAHYKGLYERGVKNMKFPRFELMSKYLTAHTLVFLICIAAMAVSVSAQKSSRTLSPEAIGIDIEQCANGPLADPNPCNVADGNNGWSRGNVNESKSHYYEGDFVPIRFIATDLTPTQQYTVTLGYDYTKGGKYATDYLGDYNATEMIDNNPCIGVTGCNPLVFTEFDIPLDPQVALGFDGVVSADDITQIPGDFTCFGCTITAVSGYTLSGATTGDSSKTFTITFTANQANIVIAYGSHISTRSDWGLANSAVNISGSPYHNFVVDFPGANGGSRDLQLSASAVIFPANIIIEKTVVNVFLQTSGGQSFGFTSSAAIFGDPTSTTFSLVDLVSEPYSNLLPPREGGETAPSAGITLFGAGNLITVTEDTPPTGWSLAGITCTSTNGTNNNTVTIGSRQVAIQLEEGELVHCKFHNSQLTPSAAPASISGRVLNSFGAGIGGARLTVVDAASGETFAAISNPFGYYTVEGTEVGNFYIMTVSHKQYVFADNTRTFTLQDNVSGMDFIANPLD